MQELSDDDKQNIAKPNEDSVTFSPPEEEVKKEEFSPKQKEIQDYWKDEYSRLGDLELKKIIEESNKSEYKFSDGITRQYIPIKNKDWKEMTRMRRQWQRLQEGANASATSAKEIDQLDKLESMIDEYYAKMCEYYFKMTRDEYDNLPPSETIMFVEACNHKTIHPLPFRARV